MGGLSKYLKAAFLNGWNLLAFGVSLSLALISGRGDVLVPLVLAAEAAYLGLLGTYPKFQLYIDQQQHRQAREARTAGSEQMLRRILAVLPAEKLQQYESLKDRCHRLREIAATLGRGPQPHFEEPRALGELQVLSLDQLLWVYLKLLFSKFSLERFLTDTDENQIRRDLEQLQKRLQTLGRSAGDHSHSEKFRTSLEDNLQTCRDRLSNYQKVRDNDEFVGLELNRLENKIQSLLELAINRQDPDFIAAEVNGVAESMIRTERAMSELQFLTGLETTDEPPPEILRAKQVHERNEHAIDDEKGTRTLS